MMGPTRGPGSRNSGGGGIIEPFDMYTGYGDDAPLGFMADSSTFTPQYRSDLGAVSNALAPEDFVGNVGERNFDKIVHDLAKAHGLNPNQSHWDVLNQPRAHQMGWRDRPMDPWEKDWGAYNWAFTKDPYPNPPGAPTDWATNSKSSDTGGGGPAIPEGADPASYLQHHYLGARTAYEHDMNQERQVNRARVRADEARGRGQDEFADYLDGLSQVMQRDFADGRPEPWSHYWPMAVEEFGEHHPEFSVEHGNPKARPTASADREFLVAMREAACLEFAALHRLESGAVGHG